jgi:Restriction endonuclease BamHI
MRIVETIDVISAGAVSESADWRLAWKTVKRAIEITDWPHGSGSFTIRPERHANGVGPMKGPCIGELARNGWQTERLPKQLAGVGMGNLDAILTTVTGIFGFEWETGNISSSHRAVGKLIHCMQQGGIAGGFLVVPSDSLKVHLTDRIGNNGELRAYIPLWGQMSVSSGMLRFVVIEHDSTSPTVALIPKDWSGRASQKGSRRVGRRPRRKKDS